MIQRNQNLKQPQSQPQPQQVKNQVNQLSSNTTKQSADVPNIPKLDVNLTFRYAECELLLRAIKLLPDDDKKTVIYQNLEHRLVVIRDNWLKEEKTRKAKQLMVTKNRTVDRVSKSSKVHKK